MGRINSRAKGAQAEREFIKELGLYLGDNAATLLKRNLEQTRVGGHDIVGLDGWAIEIKRYRVIKEGDLARFWDQAVEQADRVGAKPVLAYREDFRSWRVRVPIWALIGEGMSWTGVDWTAEVGIEAFAMIVREHLRCGLHTQESPPTVASNSDGPVATPR